MSQQQQRGRKEGRLNLILPPSLFEVFPFKQAACLLHKLLNGSWVGQVGPVDSRGQVEDLDPSLLRKSKAPQESKTSIVN